MHRTRSERWLIGLALLLGAVTVVVAVALDPFDPAEEKARTRYAAQLSFNAGSVLLSLLTLAHATRIQRPARLTVGLASLGLLGFGLGNWYWSYANLTGVDVPYPSLADIGFLAFPILTIAGGLALLLNARRRIQGIDLAIGVIFPLTTLIVFYAALIQPRMDTGMGALRTLFDLAYPTLDAIYVAMAGLLVYFSRPAPHTPALRRLALGMVLMAVADVLFIVGVDRGSYFTGSWIDIIYIVSVYAIGLALLRFPAASPTLDESAAPHAAAGT